MAHLTATPAPKDQDNASLCTVQHTFMSAMESTFAWLFERCWKSSISCFMLLPISPKFWYRFYTHKKDKQTRTSYYSACQPSVLACFCRVTTVPCHWNNSNLGTGLT